MPFWNKSAIDTTAAARSDRSDATRRARRLVQSWASSTRASKVAASGLETRVARAIRSALKRGREGGVIGDKTAAARSDRSDAGRRTRRLVKSTDIIASRAAMTDLETRVARAIRSALKRGRA